MEDLASEEDLLGHWPRRLLHVPTLTSYEWQPGNKYNNIPSPAYNAITYTWGRWRLKNTQLPNATAIPVRGTQWPIPRVDPAHFTAAEFEHIINMTCTLRPMAVGQSREKAKKEPDVEFVWLDVACIDQRANSPRGAAEIGRQAMIFRGAKQVYVWLTTHSFDTLSQAITTLEDFTSVDETRPRPSDAAAIHTISHFLADPWFSSLWTLQEAFLRDNAFPLSRDGQMVEYPDAYGDPQLLDIFDAGRAWCMCCEAKASSAQDPSIYTSSAALVTQRGLVALATLNAMATYEAARYRTTSRPEDRVYGIQQVFGFRLGNSSVQKSISSRTSGLGDLEIQLGVELMRRYPIISQFHVFTARVPKHDRWRMNAASVIAGYEIDTGHSLWGAMESNEVMVEFRLGPQDKGDRAVMWCGRTTTLASIIEALENASQEELFCELDRVKNALTIIPDVAGEMVGSPEYRDSGFSLTPKGERQKRLGQWMVENFGAGGVHVLMLGASSDNTCSYMFGMLLLHKPGDDMWTRIGICRWETTYLQISDIESSQKAFLVGEGWEEGSGIFGWVPEKTVV